MGDAARSMADERDMGLRRAAMEYVRALSRTFDDLVPVDVLRQGFTFRNERVSLGSFYSGIFRPRQARGPAALSIVTAPPKLGRDAPYDDGFDRASDHFVYHYRTAQQDSLAALSAAERDNLALREAARLVVPVIYFHGIAPGQYTPIAPVFVTHDDPMRRVVHLEAALPVRDIGDEGLQSDEELRRYATREVRVRLHQHRFRQLVLGAYGGKCAVCSLREASLLQAAHIIEDRDPQGAAAIINGIALCAIHHLAYDRNVMGIDPGGVVHIASRLLEEVDGPMLRNGLQGFHGLGIAMPKRRADRPDPERLEVRFSAFRAAC
jgi:putative restriction endonuclease